MQTFKTVFSFCIVLVTLGPNLHAQKGLELGPSLGLSYYFGDLNTNFDLTHPGLAAGLNGRYNFNNRVAFRIAATYGQIYADDLNSSNQLQRNRGLNFTNNIIDASAHLELNFLPFIHGSQDNRFSPFMFIGGGVFFHNPKATYDGKTLELNPLRTEGQVFGEEYSLSQFALNYGIGLKYSFNYRFSMNIELSFRHLYDDYIDDVSALYPELVSLAGDADAILASNPNPDFTLSELTGMQRGKAEDNDSFHFLKISAYYYFGTLRCPDISR